MMNRSEILGITEHILEKAGFRLSQRCCSTPCCFDLVAQGEKKLIFLRIQRNIGNLCLNDAAELQKISGCFSAIPLIIGEMTRKKSLEDDTVYTRYDICAITTKTLESVLLRKVYPLIEAGPGGYYVKLDGSLIRKKRQQVGLSVGKLAEMVGISRRTLYGYENEMAKASVPTAYKLEWILGAPVAQTTKVFQGPERVCFLAKTRRIFAKHHFLKEIFRKLAQFNFKVTSTGKAPFDFMARCPERGLKIIGGVADIQQKNLNQRIREVKNLGDVIGAHAIFISCRERSQDEKAPFIWYKVLTKMKCPEDLITQLSYL
jgi:putative transcriptional regulator